METFKSKTMSEARIIDLLNCLGNSTIPPHQNQAKTTEDIKVENILAFLDKSKEVISRFKEYESDGQPAMLKGWFRKLLGHILKAIGNWLLNIGDGLINENP